MRAGTVTDGTRTVVAVRNGEGWFTAEPQTDSVLDLLGTDVSAGSQLANGYRPTVPFRPARNVMCLGKNFHAHAVEFAAYQSETEAVPSHPIVFTKAPEALCGAEDTIEVRRDLGSSLDYEAELGVVIGRDGARIRAEDALDHIAGYTVVNDVTARDVQERHRQWFLGKSLPGATPIGPVVVTPDELGDLDSLRITCHVNGELRQSAILGDMIFGIAETIEIVSTLVPLRRGDIISMGTPSGVGIGFTPPRFLADGDLVVCAIEGIGELRNFVRLAEPE